jgi:hypothetical protein
MFAQASKYLSIMLMLGKTPQDCWCFPHIWLVSRITSLCIPQQFDASVLVDPWQSD